MSYALYSEGRLLDGADEQQALAAAAAVFKVSEDRAREVLLSGKRTKITTHADGDRLQKLCDHLRRAGLDVEVVATEAPSPVTQQVAAAEASDPVGRRRRPMLAIAVAMVLLLLAVAGGMGWYWLYVAVPAPVLKAESALADGHMVAIGYADVQKASTLASLTLGGFDPHALAAAGSNRELLKGLFSGPPRLADNLRQAVLAVHVNPEDHKAGVTLLLAGSFDASSLTHALAQAFDVAPMGTGKWRLTWKAHAANATATSCPGKTPAATRVARPRPLILRIAPHWAMFSSESSSDGELWRRLESGAHAKQALARWRHYRRGQLAAFLVQAPSSAAHALQGFPGMVAADAARRSPELQAVGAAVAVDIPARGLNLGVTLFSDKAAWNRSITDKARRKLAAWKKEGGALSPTLVKLVSRVSAEDSANGVSMRVSLDKGVLSDIQDVVRDVAARIFTPTVTRSHEAASGRDQIEKYVADYAIYDHLKALPNHLKSYHKQPPLFADGPYGVDLASIKSRNNGALELNLKGMVQLPAGRPFAAPRIEKISLAVESVEGRDGVNLMRNEICDPPKHLFGPKNQEPATNFSISNQQALLTKHVRLNPGVNVEDIAAVKGVLKFAAPTVVRKLAVPLHPGAAVEAAGMRFYLSGVRGSTVTYQVSGDPQRLLEVRALNKEGKPLRSGWSMGGGDGGRVSRTFRGRIRGLEIFVAEKWLKVEKPFVLRDLLAVAPQPKDKAPRYFAPARIDPRAWTKYARLDFGALKVNPRDWMSFNGKAKTIGERKWPGLKAYFTYKRAKYGNDPTAHIYFGALPELPGVLSALSYRVVMPAPGKGPAESFVRISYPYYTNSGALALKDKLHGLPIAHKSFALRTGLKPDQPLGRLKGEFIVRLPTKTASTSLPLKGLWQGKTAHGVKVTLTSINRGMFPGYALKIEGAVDRLVNVHGLSADGHRVAARPVNFQSDGSWTMTLPFGQGIRNVEVVTASRQKVMRFPFDVK